MVCRCGHRVYTWTLNVLSLSCLVDSWKPEEPCIRPCIRCGMWDFWRRHTGTCLNMRLSDGNSVIVRNDRSSAFLWNFPNSDNVAGVGSLVRPTTVDRQLKAKFHYAGPTGPARTLSKTRTDPTEFLGRPGPQKSPCGSRRARVVEFSL